MPLVVVLGASGFVGSGVLAALAGRPPVVRAVARRPAVVPDGAENIEVHTADLTAPGAVAEAVAGADAIVHLALHSSGWRGAADDNASDRVNVDVMRELIEALRGRAVAPPVVFAGSASQVGPPPRVPIDGTEPDSPATPYDRQKQAAEAILKQASEAGVVRGVSLRLPTVYGPAPGVDRGVLSSMIRKALAGEPLTMWHDGTVQREFVYVDDVAAAFLAALHHAVALAGRHWLLGDGRGDRVGDVFRLIAELVSVHTGKPPVPVVSVPPPPSATGTDFHDMVVDSSAFRAATGWRPAVSLREGLTRTIEALA